MKVTVLSPNIFMQSVTVQNIGELLWVVGDNNSQTPFSALRLFHVAWPRVNHFKISLFKFPICANADDKTSLSHRMTGDIIS